MGQEGPYHRRHRDRAGRPGRLLVVPPAHQHPFDGHLDVRGRVHPAAAVPGVLEPFAQLQGGHREGRGEPGQGEGVQVRELRAGGRGRAGRAWCRDVALHLPRQRREVRHGAADDGGQLRAGYQGGELLGDPRYRPRLGRAAGQPRDGLHSRVREPVRDIAAVQPDQLPELAGAREPAGVCGPVQVVHEPRGRHPRLRAGEHDDAGCGDRAP